MQLLVWTCELAVNQIRTSDAEEAEWEHYLDHLVRIATTQALAKMTSPAQTMAELNSSPSRKGGAQ